MKILKKSLLSATLLVLITPCIKAESQDKTASNQVEAQKKETEAQKLGKELLDLLQGIVRKNLKMCCPCCPGNQSCTIDTKTALRQAQDDREDEKEQEKEKDIQKAIDLIEKGADVNYVTGMGASPLGAAVTLDNLELVKLLLQKNANPEPSDISSPLIANIIFGEKIEIAKLLIENGANVNFQTCNGQTPLMLAITKNKLELVRLLIEKGADVNTQAKIEMASLKMSFTALAIAVGMQNLPMVELLLENGADPSIKNKDGQNQDKYKDGKTALEQAKEFDNKELIEILLKYEAKK
ncbi:ankyrin repeat domain-containing protein [Candidatus Dependentiae bacterium]